MSLRGDAGAEAAGGASGAVAAAGAAGSETAGDGAAGLDTSSGATAGSAGMLSTAGAAAAPMPIDVPDVADAQTLALAEACSVIDLTTVPGQCEEAVAMGQIGCRDHVLYDACTFFQFALSDAAHEGSPTAVCRRRCMVLESSPFWVEQCDECTNSCPPPQPGVFVHELDTADCLERPPTPCDTSFGTEQANLNATLLALIAAQSDWGTLRNGSLELQLEHGCVARYYVSGAAFIPMDNPDLDAALAAARFECAEQLSCMHIQGGDTLATQ